jgi:hypothetical protein
VRLTAAPKPPREGFSSPRATCAPLSRQTYWSPSPVSSRTGSAPWVSSDLCYSRVDMRGTQFVSSVVAIEIHSRPHFT